MYTCRDREGFLAGRFRIGQVLKTVFTIGGHVGVNLVTPSNDVFMKRYAATAVKPCSAQWQDERARRTALFLGRGADGVGWGTYMRSLVPGPDFLCGRSAERARFHCEASRDASAIFYFPPTTTITVSNQTRLAFLLCR